MLQSLRDEPVKAGLPTPAMQLSDRLQARGRAGERQHAGRWGGAVVKRVGWQLRIRSSSQSHLKAMPAITPHDALPT